MQAFHPYSIFHLGDSALTIDFGGGIDEDVNRKVMRLFHQLQKAKHTAVLDLVPAYATLTVHYDVTKVERKDEDTAFDVMAGWIRTATPGANDATLPQRKLRIPVCYQGRHAPDLEAVAAHHSLSTEEVIAIHTAAVYRVYMTGFLPGFAYMGAVDERIATPRRPSPRKHVAAGSVGIAGRQTGIYPLDSPGGWQLIGQTPRTLFDAEKESPALLQPGDEVMFYAIPENEFAHHQDRTA